MTDPLITPRKITCPRHHRWTTLVSAGREIAVRTCPECRPSALLDSGLGRYRPMTAVERDHYEMMDRMGR